MNNGNRFHVVAWKPYLKNTLRGFLSLELPSGLILHDCTLHQRNESRWVGLPGRPYQKPDGTTSWSPVVEIPENAAREKFQRGALAAVDDYFDREGAA